MKKGLLLVVSGPSGVGKGAILSQLIGENENFHYSVSATTRAPRSNEIDGTNYFFITKPQFEQRIEDGDMLEYASYNNNYYGTPRKEVEKQLSEGKDVILEIEVKGALSIQRTGIPAVYIFILPPNLSELEKRLRGRGTNTEGDILNRLSISKEEISSAGYYDYVVINDEVEFAKKKIISIVEAEHTSKSQMSEYIEKNF